MKEVEHIWAFSQLVLLKEESRACLGITKEWYSEINSPQPEAQERVDLRYWQSQTSHQNSTERAYWKYKMPYCIISSRYHNLYRHSALRSPRKRNPKSNSKLILSLETKILKGFRFLAYVHAREWIVMNWSKLEYREGKTVELPFGIYVILCSWLRNTWN